MKYCFVMLLFPLASFAQKMKTSVDKLSGATTYQTGLQKIYSKSGFGKAGEILNTSVSKTNDTYLLTFIPVSGTINLTSIDSTNKTYIKFESGKIDTLQIGNAQVLEYQPGYAYRVMLNYHLTSEQIADLTNSTIALVRIETNDRNANYEIEEKNSSAIKKALALLP